MRFSKWHALGNSYVLVERGDAAPLCPERVRRLCDRDTGIGSDGVLEVVTRRGPRAGVIVWNPDGSRAEMSGNGVRIAAGWLARESGEREVVVDVSGREVAAALLDDERIATDLGEVAVGEPEHLEVGERVELVTASVGNPHAVVRLDTATRADLLRLGPLIEVDERFPQRTNVQLVEVLDRHALRVLVWERGAGETRSSGSSSVAAAAVAVARGWCDSPVRVHLPGGELVVGLAGRRATLTGPAEEICKGETPL